MSRMKGRVLVLFLFVVIICSTQSRSVYFSAFTNRHYGNQELKNGNAIKYQDVETNKGECYSPDTGVFTVPQTGVYQIYWDYLVSDGNLWLALMKNGVIAAKSLGSYRSSYWENISRTILLKLEEGDELYIAYHSGQGSVYGSEGRYTGFSGILIDDEL